MKLRFLHTGSVRIMGLGCWCLAHRWRGRPRAGVLAAAERTPCWPHARECHGVRCALALFCTVL